MGLGHYVVDAIVLEGRSPRELARTHHLSRSWSDPWAISHPSAGRITGLAWLGIVSVEAQR